jgi:hypothetical protein
MVLSVLVLVVVVGPAMGTSVPALVLALVLVVTACTVVVCVTLAQWLGRGVAGSGTTSGYTISSRALVLVCF